MSNKQQTIINLFSFKCQTDIQHDMDKTNEITIVLKLVLQNNNAKM